MYDIIYTLPRSCSCHVIMRLRSAHHGWTSYPDMTTPGTLTHTHRHTHSHNTIVLFQQSQLAAELSLSWLRSQICAQYISAHALYIGPRARRGIRSSIEREEASTNPLKISLPFKQWMLVSERKTILIDLRERAIISANPLLLFTVEQGTPNHKGRGPSNQMAVLCSMAGVCQ